MLECMVVESDASPFKSNIHFPIQAKYLTRNVVAGTVEAVKELDDFLCQLVVSFVLLQI